ncbi:MAG: DUF4440 domain-containing protein, partial [Pseudomonadota bacterium]
ESILHPDAVYAFPPPMGIFAGNAFVGQMSEEGPCTDVEITQQHAAEADGVVALAYHGVGQSAQGARASHCTSTWVSTDDGWKLMAHHQTPVDA